MDPLITAGDLNAYLQRTVPANLADLAVAGASGIVRAYCQWDISQQLGAEFWVDADGSRVLGLPTLHVSAVDSVTVDGELIDPTEYVWSARGQLYRHAGWPRWSKANVVADTGYAEIPDVVKIVSLSLASRYVNNPSGLKTATVGAVQRTFAGPELNTLELALLDPFRLK